MSSTGNVVTCIASTCKLPPSGACMYHISGYYNDIQIVVNVGPEYRVTTCGNSRMLS